MRVYHGRGGLIGESQERVARANSLPGDVGVSLTTMIPLLLTRGCLTSPKGSDKRNSDLRILVDFINNEPLTSVLSLKYGNKSELH